MPAFDLQLYFRGPLSSCNYDCDYCPFAKHVSSRDELVADRLAVERFVEWCERHDQRRLSILFTPWGEGLIRRWYRDALLRLAALPHVVAVAIQTNLSTRLDWLDRLDALPEHARAALGLWTTYHPTQVALDRFVERSAELVERRVVHSVGVVGLREHFPAIAELRERLDPGVYLWINAYKSAGPGYYAADEHAWLSAIDPLFEHNAVRHRSLGQACSAGASSLLVRGDGSLARCHFVERIVGNLYADDLDRVLGPSPCPQSQCGCFIGYAHLDRLGLRERFGTGLAARVLPIATQ
ncbi:STM4011 family radical SAM protein [Nannocystaceae bacterium ST9]